jgi:hypothetical protein
VLIYTVHEPADGAAEKAVLIKEGFSRAAFFAGPFWLMAHRMWLVLAGYLVALLLLSIVLLVVPGGARVAGIVLVLASSWFALEANQLRRWTLGRRGYRQVASVTGRTEDECEHRYFASQTSRPRDAMAPAHSEHNLTQRISELTQPPQARPVPPSIGGVGAS